MIIFALRMPGYTTYAEKTVQENMLKLWLVTPKLREEIALEAYLKMMARNYMGGDEVPKKQRIASKFAWDFIMII